MYHYQVPENKIIRVIIHTDCKNEADDQFALAHHLMTPQIVERMTAVWIGGSPYPCGGFEFNLFQDIAAANIVFNSQIPLWQVPENVYKNMEVSLAELQYKVAPCGKLGNYLFGQMIDFNNRMTEYVAWPHGESWGLGDQGTVTVLLEENNRGNWDLIPAPAFSKEMYYIHKQSNRAIRVYQSLDARFTLEDFYAKLAINFLPLS